MKRHIITLSALVAATSLSAHADNLTVNEHSAEATSVQIVETANNVEHETTQPKNENKETKIKYQPIDLDTDNGVVSLAGSKGFVIQSKKGDFVFKPYMLVQTSGNLIGTTMRDSTRHTTKITLRTQVLPSPMPYLVLRVEPLARYRLTYRSMLLKQVATFCNKHGLM